MADAPRLAEIDIWRAARQMIDLYDLDAGWRAGLRADQLYEDSDVDGYSFKYGCSEGDADAIVTFSILASFLFGQIPAICFSR